MPRGKVSTGGLGLLLILLLACTPAAETPPPAAGPVPGGTLLASILTDIDTVNDLISSGSTHQRNVERLLFLELARENDNFKEGPATFEPQLAERWEFSDDGLTLTFHLRESSWSDGAPLTAEDVRWTWQAQIDPEVAWRHRRSKSSIEDVEVLDSRTVRFHFGATSPDQLEDANRGGILPRHVWSGKPFSEWRSAGGWFAETIVTSGPFRVEEWRPNQELVLRRNERYYRTGFPLLDRFVVRVIPEKPSQVRQLLGGSIDYLQILPPDQIERIEADPDTAVDAYWGRRFDYLCWNTRRAPMDNAETRRALTLAIDRQAIVDSIYRGYAKVGITGVLSTTWAFDPTLEPWPFEPREAERLLIAAGFDGTDEDGMRLELELLVQNGNRVHLDSATLIQAQLARVGVRLKLRPVEFQTWVDRLKKGDFDAAIGGWDIPSSLDMSFAFHTEEIGKFNFGGYSNAELDGLLDAARRATSVEERRPLLHEIQAVLHHDQPYTFLWEPQILNARRARVRDSRPNALSAFYNIDEWWLGE